MECRCVSGDNLAERYLNGQLAQPLQDEFEVHLLECPECLKSVESLKELRSAVASEAPRIRLAPEGRRSPLWFWSLATASLLILATFALFQWRKSGSSVAKNQVLLRRQTVVPQTNDQPVPTGPTTSAQKEAPEAERKTASAASGGQPRNVPNSAGTLPSPVTAPEIATQIEQPAATIAETKPAEVHHQAPTKPHALTSAEATELYKLAEVHPAPYYPAERSVGAAPSKAAAVDAAISNGSTATLFQQAMVTYMEGNYREARTMLESTALAAPESPTIDFYLGVCRLLVGRTDEGIAALIKVTADGKSRFVQPAHIYLAKGYLQKADLKHAEEELNLASGMSGRLTTEAASLLTRVRALRTAVGNVEPATSQ